VEIAKLTEEYGQADTEEEKEAVKRQLDELMKKA